MNLYPKHRGKRREDISPKILAETIKINLNYNGQHYKVIREAMNALYGYFERNENFHWGLSEKCDPEFKHIVEHAIPVKVLISKLKYYNFSTAEEILNFIKKYYCVFMISFEEDALLNMNGLRSSIPEDSDLDDLLARYKKVGINVQYLPNEFNKKEKDMLTLEEFNNLPKGEVFATGVLPNSPDGIFMTRDGGELRWVAKNGFGVDWAIYCHWSNRSVEWIRDYGDKIHTDEYIKRCVPCEDIVLKKYRF